MKAPIAAILTVTTLLLGIPPSARAQEGEEGRIFINELPAANSKPKAPPPLLYPAIVVGDGALAYALPSLSSAVLGRFSRNAKLDVISQAPEWYKIRIEGGGFAWVEKSRVNLAKDLAAKAQEAVAPSTGQLKREELKAGPDVFSGLSLGGGYVYDIHRFGTHQYRLGIEYAFPLTKNLGVGIPLNLAFGSGFKSIQPGVDLLWRFWSNEPWGAFARFGVLFEYFFGNGRSFTSAAGDLGAGIQYRMADWILFELEPVSMEYNPFNTHRIPAFLRGQALLRVRFLW